MSPHRTGSPQNFYSQIVHTEYPAVCHLRLWFSSPSAGSHGGFTLRKPQLPLFTCGPPQSQGWQFVSFDRCKRRSPFPILIFFLNYTHLSHPFQYHGFIYFLPFWVFAPRFAQDWLPGFVFWLKFLLWAGSLTTHLNQDLSVMSSHFHFLFVVFIKPDIILFIYLLVYCLSLTAAAKSLQSCPTLGDPIEGSPPGSPIPGILQARTLE